MKWVQPTLRSRELDQGCVGRGGRNGDGTGTAHAAGWLGLTSPMQLVQVSAFPATGSAHIPPIRQSSAALIIKTKWQTHIHATDVCKARVKITQETPWEKPVLKELI